MNVTELVQIASAHPSRTAREAGIARSTLNRIATGKTQHSLESLREIALTLGFDVELNINAAADPGASQAARYLLDNHVNNAEEAWLARFERWGLRDEELWRRGEGTVAGGGHVQLTDGRRIEGIPADELPRDHANLMAALASITDRVLRSMVIFSSATRSQFYFDGNKRTARLMMAGELLSHGYDAINVPYARALEFNLALDQLFNSDDATEMLKFLASC